MENILIWQKNFGSFQIAMGRLNEAVEPAVLNELERDGMLHRFKYCFDLAVKTLSEYMKNKGYAKQDAPDAILKQAISDGCIKDADGWNEMLRGRSLIKNTYIEGYAIDLANRIKNQFYPLLKQLEDDLEKEKQ